MTDAQQLLLPLRPGLVPVPAAGQPGICRFCHSSCPPEYAQCYPCRQAEQAVGAVEILPVSMSVEGDLLHRYLRGYKDDRDLRVQKRMTMALAGLLAVFLHRHQPCVGDYDSICAVPSVQRCAPDQVISRIPQLRVISPKTMTTDGSRGHKDLRLDRFRLTRAVDRERVLLVDDTFTRGGSVFSAAATLKEAGAIVVGPLVLGRHVQPNFGPSEAMLSWLGGRAWNENRCCRCDGEQQRAGSLF
jgi:hypothetical protein